MEEKKIGVGRGRGRGRTSIAAPSQDVPKSPAELPSVPDTTTPVDKGKHKNNISVSACASQF